MGFASGFSAGFNAVDATVRRAQDEERYQEEKKNRDEERAWRREEREKAKKLDADVRAAATEPTVQQGYTTGAPGNRVFSKDAETAAVLAQQQADVDSMTSDAPVTPAAATAATGVGNKVYTDQSAAAAAAAGQSGQLGYVKRVSEAYRANGKAAESIQMEQLYKAMKKEGGIDALDAALNPGATEDDIAKAYNEAGSHRIKAGTLKREFYDTDLPGFGKVRTARLSAEGEDGKPIQIENALAARMSFLPFEKKLDVQAKGVEAGQRDRQVAVAERGAAVAEGGLDVQRQNANTQEQYRKDQAKFMEANLGLKRAEIAGVQARFNQSHALAQKEYELKLKQANSPTPGVAWKDVEPQLNRTGDLAVKMLGPTQEDPEEIKGKDGKVTRPRQDKLSLALDASTAAGSVIRQAALMGQPIAAEQALQIVTQGQLNPKAEIIQRNAAGETRTITGAAFVLPNGQVYPVGPDVPKRFMPPPAQSGKIEDLPNARFRAPAGAPSPAAAAASMAPPTMNQQASAALQAAQAQTVTALRAAAAQGNQAEVARLNQMLIQQGAALQAANAGR